MYRINTSYAADPSPQQPFNTATLDFLQDGIKDQVRMICRSMIRQAGFAYSSVVPYQMFNGGGSGRYIFFDDELYFMQAPAGGNNIGVLIIQSGTGDPITFTDNVARAVLDMRIIDPQTGTLGAGLFDLADIVDISLVTWTAISLLNGYSAYTANPEFKVEREVVTLRGNATVATGTVSKIADMPAGSIPGDVRYIHCTTWDGTNYISNLLIVNTTGEVNIQITSGAPVIVYLDGLSYSL